MELDLNDVDIHCIKHFGYNTVGDVNALRAKQDKEHLIIEEFEYRNEMLEKEIEQIKYIKRNFDYCVAQERKKLENKIIQETEEIGKIITDLGNIARKSTDRAKCRLLNDSKNECFKAKMILQIVLREMEDNNGN